MLSEICRQFPGCLPSELLREDTETVLGILEARDYARAKAAIDAAQTEEQLDRMGISEWGKDQVLNVENELFARRRLSRE